MTIKANKEEKRIQISLDFYEATDLVCLYLPVVIADQKKEVEENRKTGSHFLARSTKELKWLESFKEKLDQVKEEI